MSTWEWEVLRGKELVARGNAENGEDARVFADAASQEFQGARRFAQEVKCDGTAEMWLRVLDGQWERYQ